MVLWSYPPTRTQLKITICAVLTSAVLIAVGAHLSYANIAPQQARTKARSDYIKARLRKFIED